MFPGSNPPVQAESSDKWVALAVCVGILAIASLLALWLYCSYAYPSPPKPPDEKFGPKVEWLTKRVDDLERFNRTLRIFINEQDRIQPKEKQIGAPE